MPGRVTVLYLFFFFLDFYNDTQSARGARFSLSPTRHYSQIPLTELCFADSPVELPSSNE
jgi:hypothetical protein